MVTPPSYCKEEKKDLPLYHPDLVPLRWARVCTSHEVFFRINEVSSVSRWGRSMPLLAASHEGVPS